MLYFHDDTVAVVFNVLAEFLVYSLFISSLARLRRPCPQ
jgi:hypothetical protein